MKARYVLAACALAAIGPWSARAQDVLIRGAKVHTVSQQGTLDDADVLIRDGRIAAIGKALAPAGAAVVEAKGRPLTPGFYAGIADLGLVEVWGAEETVDFGIGFGAPAWQQRWRPEFDVTLAFNPDTTLIPITRIEGITWTVLAPDSADGIIAGQGAAATLSGAYDAVIDGSRTLFVNWNGASAVSGGTRGGLYLLLDQALQELKSKVPADRALLTPAGRETLAGYVRGGRMVFSVERAADIRGLIAFAQRKGFKPIINGGSEAWKVAQDLARAQIPVILNPLVSVPVTFDQMAAQQDNAALLHQAGVRIAFSAGEIHNARKIRQLAGNAVAHGLPWEVALAAVTAVPAEIFGIGATRGRIAVGQVADLVLWDADPLDVTSAAEQVWIAGRAIEMRSRQTQLRDRYFKRGSTQ